MGWYGNVKNQNQIKEREKNADRRKRRERAKGLDQIPFQEMITRKRGRGLLPLV